MYVNNGHKTYVQYMSKWPQDQYTRCNVSEIKRKGKKDTYKSSLHPSVYTLPLSPKLTLPL